MQALRDWWKYWSLSVREPWLMVILAASLLTIWYVSTVPVFLFTALMLLGVVPLAIVVFMRMIANLGPTPVPLWRDEKLEE
jgi:Zn-dependent membrane protease YugP